MASRVKTNLGLNEAKVAKMIKAADKAGRLGVALVDGMHYVTNSHWILRLLPYHTKAIAAIVEAVGPVTPSNDPDYTMGSLRVKTQMVVDLFNKTCAQEGEEADLTRWLYNSEDMILRFVDTPSKSYAFQDCYLEMFDNLACTKKVVTTNSPAPNTHLLVYHFQGEPLGIILEVKPRTGFADLPRIRMEVA